MPVVMNIPNRGEKKPETTSPSSQAATAPGGGLLSNGKARGGLIAVVVVLAIGLLGWSMGWFGGGAAPETSTTNAPATATTNSPMAAASSPPGGVDGAVVAPDDTGNPAAVNTATGNTIGRKRNHDVDK